MLLWIFVYKFLWGSIFSFHIYIYIEVLRHVITLCLSFWEASTLFSKMGTWLCIPTSIIGGFWFLHMLPTFCIIATLVNVKWYLDVILICSLMTNDIEHIFMYYLVICISAFGKCLLYPLPNFNWFVCLLVLNCRILSVS